MHARKITLAIFSVFAVALTSGAQTLYDYYLVKGSAKIVSREYDQALFYLTKATERYPDSAGAWYHRGGANYFLVNLDDALNDFNTTLKLDPSYTEVYKWRGMIYHQKAEYAKAGEDYALFLRDHPDDFFVNIKLAETQIQLKEFKKAETALKDILVAQPKNAMAHNAMGLLHEAKEEPAKAIESFSTAIAIDPTQGQYFMNRARILYAGKRTDEACNDWNSAYQLGILAAANLQKEANCLTTQLDEILQNGSQKEE